MGVSKIVSGDNLNATRVGTPLYLAPELIKQQPYDFKVDIWALGCVLYHLSSLEPPFNGENLISLGFNIVHKNPKNIPNIYSNKLSKFIFKILEKNPSKRPNCKQLLEFFSESVEIIPSIISISNRENYLEKRSSVDEIVNEEINWKKKDNEDFKKNDNNEKIEEEKKKNFNYENLHKKKSGLNIVEKNSPSHHDNHEKNYEKKEEKIEKKQEEILNKNDIFEGKITTNNEKKTKIRRPFSANFQNQLGFQPNVNLKGNQLQAQEKYLSEQKNKFFCVNNGKDFNWQNLLIVGKKLQNFEEKKDKIVNQRPQSAAISSYKMISPKFLSNKINFNKNLPNFEEKKQDIFPRNISLNKNLNKEEKKDFVENNLKKNYNEKKNINHKDLISQKIITPPYFIPENLKNFEKNNNNINSFSFFKNYSNLGFTSGFNLIFLIIKIINLLIFFVFY